MPSPPKKTTEKATPKRRSAPQPDEAVTALTSLFRQVQDQVAVPRPTLDGEAKKAAEEHARIARILAVAPPDTLPGAQIPAVAEERPWDLGPLAGAGPDRTAKKSPGPRRAK